ncbi:MAG: alpha-glucan family phosphorylase [bacterium]|nr:alpha-glucan family phosphorylase [bacterium]
MDVERRISYFTMEIGISQDIPTYSGGLGILAGDTVKSFADLKVPVVCVTLLHRKGYFSQKITKDGDQEESSVKWKPIDHLRLLPGKVKVEIEKRKVIVQAWEYKVVGTSGFEVPVLFLDTDIKGNSEYDKNLTQALYGGDNRYRLSQEVILGIGGVRILDVLGYRSIKKYHMNEGHASLLILELLRMHKKSIEETWDEKLVWDVDEVRELCVFTTHTPVPAGHDKFSYDLVWEVLGEFIHFDVLKGLAGYDALNMTLLALNCSSYVNGVAKRHGEVSKQMFPGYPVGSITNGVHSYTWTSQEYRNLYDKHIPGWTKDPFTLRHAASIPKPEIWNAHIEAKKRLVDYVNEKTGVGMDYETFTIGFARRATAYKRAELLFSNPQELKKISKNSGKFQVIYGGKAHPKDQKGKDLIKRIHQCIEELKNEIKIVYLENYEIELGKLITAGVDIWLNTPQRPMEASGTSGMKASHNGIPNFSILDGWWVEGHIEGITGWSIGEKNASDKTSDKEDVKELYGKLKNVIIPMYYQKKWQWVDVMQCSIAFNASFFNTHRMVQQYVFNAYFE